MNDTPHTITWMDGKRAGMNAAQLALDGWPLQVDIATCPVDGIAARRDWMLGVARGIKVIAITGTVDRDR